MIRDTELLVEGLPSLLKSHGALSTRTQSSVYRCFAMDEREREVRLPRPGPPGTTVSLMRRTMSSVSDAKDFWEALASFSLVVCLETALFEASQNSCFLGCQD